MNNKNVERLPTLVANAETGNKKTMSKIAFPYTHLEKAINLVDTIRKKAGKECESKQLAAWLGLDYGGTFKAMQTAAKTFKLLDSVRGQGKVFLTELGEKITDPKEAAAAKKTAFLSVLLYKKINDEYGGHPLLSDIALEKQIIDWGVPAKQARRARQVFYKSAQYAGFIDKDSGRFVEPAVRTDKLEKPFKKYSSGDGGGISPDSHELIKGMVKSLPEIPENWPNEKTPFPENEIDDWIQGVKGILKMIYDTTNQPKGE